ncbi:MAG: prolyl oligopeptidase family serine peptidase [Candidatus Mcinerneyibacterium aminivorans]|uniref:Prolyl oligopeptidase family serine peptidase n=1 Tax=Candidatus Mcinerneyibacterium aminivorans TaxID=2703815 RepID=A0A5D0MHB1_9BACT|nr:MAG: prolyl oligopeptidase family serine peptidase [Candidatus Mcinerneyibacterium aminivorans]
MERKIFPYRSNLIKEKRDKIGEIPVLRFYPDNGKKELPTIIYYHGWSSSKNFQRFKASTIAQYGFHLIVPDAINHGVRNPIDYEEDNAIENYFWDTVLSSVEESTFLLNSIKKYRETDPERIGVIGSSMGGFIGSGVLIKNSGIKTLISFNGACSWIEMDKILRKEAEVPEANKNLIEKLEKYDAMKNIEKINQRPILMLHGDIDTSVPIEGQEKFYEKAIGYYTNKDRLELYEVPDINHYITVNMLEKAIEWAKEYI